MHARFLRRGIETPCTAVAAILLLGVAAAAPVSRGLEECPSSMSLDDESARHHLFLLSGQSNMAGLKPERTFTPALEAGLEGQRVTVVKDAAGGQPIRRWYKKWKPAEGVAPPKEARPPGNLYDQLIEKTVAALEGAKPDTVTFVWMQGERDANEGHGAVYAAALSGLIDQLRGDLEKREIYTGRMHGVVGRLSDFSVGNEKYQHWDEVRAAQVAVAKDREDVDWIDTDPWNGPKDDLHLTKEGYDELGRAFGKCALTWLAAWEEEAIKGPGRSTRSPELRTPTGPAPRRS